MLTLVSGVMYNPAKIKIIPVAPRLNVQQAAHSSSLAIQQPQVEYFRKKYDCTTFRGIYLRLSPRRSLMIDRRRLIRPRGLKRR